MARKTESFKLEESKKVIVLYDNIEPSAAEQTLINYYLSNGFMPMLETKKKGKTVAEMREDLKADEETLKKFNTLYDEKGGFHKACKVYAEWKKANKTKK